MPRWLLRVFLVTSAALLIAVWVAVFVQNELIRSLLRDIDRVDERLTRIHFLLYPVAP